MEKAVLLGVDLPWSQRQVGLGKKVSLGGSREPVQTFPRQPCWRNKCLVEVQFRNARPYCRDVTHPLGDCFLLLLF